MSQRQMSWTSNITVTIPGPWIPALTGDMDQSTSFVGLSPEDLNPLISETVVFGMSPCNTEAVGCYYCYYFMLTLCTQQVHSLYS